MGLFFSLSSFSSSCNQCQQLSARSPGILGEREGLFLVHTYLDRGPFGVSAYRRHFSQTPAWALISPSEKEGLRTQIWEVLVVLNAAKVLGQSDWRFPSLSGFRLSLHFGLSICCQLTSSLLFQPMSFILHPAKCCFHWEGYSPSAVIFMWENTFITVEVTCVWRFCNFQATESAVTLWREFCQNSVRASERSPKPLIVGSAMHWFSKDFIVILGKSI